MMKIIQILFIISMLQACSGKQVDKKDGGIALKPDEIKLKENGSIKINDLVKDVEAIVLETNNECRIAKISQFIEYEGRFYIWDSKTKCIYVFTDQGQYLHKIDRQGRGPQEYIGINNFIISKRDKCIKVHDGFNRAVICYDLNGKFIKRIKLGYYLHQFGEFSNGNYWAYVSGLYDSKKHGADVETKFVIFSSKGEVLKEVVGVPYEGPSYSFSVFQKDDKLVYTEPLNYTIQEFKNNELSVRYPFTFNGYECANDLRDKFKDDKLSRSLHKRLQNNYIVGMDELLENESYLHFMYPYKHQVVNVYYNKKTGNVTEYKGVPMDDHSWKTVMFPIYCNNKYWYSQIPPYRFESYKTMKTKDWSCSKERRESIEEKFKNVDINDNPIIIRYVLKDI